MTGSRWHGPSIVSGVAFAGLSAVHLIDDFLAGVPYQSVAASLTISAGSTMITSFLAWRRVRGKRDGGGCLSTRFRPAY